MKIPNWAVPILVFCGLALIVFLSNRPPAAPNGVQMVTSNGEYELRSDEALELCRTPLEKFDRSEDLTEAEKVNLDKATKLYETMMLYRPTAVEPAFQAGRCYFALANTDLAEACLNQAILSGEEILRQSTANGNSSVKEATRLTLAEARYVRSLIYQSVGDFKTAFEDADYAAQQVNNSPNYLSARASCSLQLGNMQPAMNDIAYALKLDPNHKRSLQIATLIDAEYRATHPEGAKPGTAKPGSQNTPPKTSN